MKLDEAQRQHPHIGGSGDSGDTGAPSPGSSSESAVGRGRKVWEYVRDANLWPAAVTFFVGYGVGVRAAAARRAFLDVAAASGAGTSTAARTTGTVVPWPVRIRTFLLSTAVVALVGREIWRSIPAWLKRQIPFLNKKRKASSTSRNEDDVELVLDPNDMSSIPALSMRLQGLFKQASAKLATPPEGSTLQFAFLAMLSLLRIKERDPSFRDNAYEKFGTPVQDPTKELEGLDEAFEWADMAYDELPDDQTLSEGLRQFNFTLLRHDKIALPGSVAHFIALSKERKTALIGIKGTSGFEDLLTDCCGQAVQHTLEEGPFVVGGSANITCHDGIITASRRLADELELLIEELLLPNNYKLLITGHSLGAGCASLVGIILRSRFPLLRTDKGERLKVLGEAPGFRDSCGTPSGGFV